MRQRLLCHAAARAPLCLRSIPDGRRQLREVLRLATAELRQLSPACLLPHAAALPRVARRPLPPAAGDGAAVPAAAAAAGGRAVRKGTAFVRNPLAVMVRLGPDEEEGEEGEEEDDEGEGEEEEEEEEEQQQQEHEAAARAARCGGGGRLCAAEDLFVDLGTAPPPPHEVEQPGRSAGRPGGGGGAGAGGGEGAARYALHSHFGGEELGSLLRVELSTPARLVPLLEWCRAAPRRFTAAQAWRAAAEADAQLPFSEVAAVLGVLEWHGFCVRVLKARKAV